VIGFGSGFVFRAKLGDRVEKGQSIVTVHSDRPEQMPAVLERLGRAIQIGPRSVAKPKMVSYLVDKDGVRPWPY
jgi:thymidine phosphorylase